MINFLSLRHLVCKMGIIIPTLYAPHIGEVAQGLIGGGRKVLMKRCDWENKQLLKERASRWEKIRQDGNIRNKPITATVVGKSANNPTGKNHKLKNFQALEKIKLVMTWTLKDILWKFRTYVLTDGITNQKGKEKSQKLGTIMGSNERHFSHGFQTGTEFPSISE